MKKANISRSIYLLLFLCFAIDATVAKADGYKKETWHKTFHVECEQNIKKACDMAFDYHRRKLLFAKWMGPRYTPPIFRKSIQARLFKYEKNCKKGEQKACKKLSGYWGQLVEQQWDDPNPLPFDASTTKLLAIKYARKACKLGNITACIAWGKFIHGFQKSLPIKFYKEACRSGSLAFCFFVMIEEKKPKTSKELLPFRSIINKVCLNPYHEKCLPTCQPIRSLACNYAVDIESLVTKRKYDFIRYAALACQMNSAEDCVRLAQLKKDNKEKLALFEKACRIAPKYGCFEAADLLQRLEKDRDKMLKLYQRACQAKSERACWELATVYEEGKLAPKDIHASTQVYKKLCGYGEQGACFLQIAGWIFILPENLQHILLFVLSFLFLLIVTEDFWTWLPKSLQ